MPLRVDGSLSPIARANLGIDVRHMPDDGMRGYEQLLCHFSVRDAGSDKAKDFYFTFGEAIGESTTNFFAGTLGKSPQEMRQGLHSELFGDR